MTAMNKLTVVLAAFFLFGFACVHTPLIPGGATSVSAHLETRAARALERAGHGAWAQVSVVGRTATVTGHAETAQQRDTAIALVRNATGEPGGLFTGLTQVRDEVAIVPRVSPYTLTAIVEPSGRWRVVGYAPDQRTAEGIARAVERRSGQSAADAASIEIAAGAPERGDWLEAVQFGLDILDRLDAGRFEIVGHDITINGVARSQAQRDFIQHIARTPPRGFSQTLTIDAPQAPPRPETNCSAEIRDIARSGRITFAPSSDQLEPASQSALNQILGLMRFCRSDERIRIEGHTDASGDPAINYQLSQLRAQTVRDFLVNGGLDADRFDIQGFGATRPLVDGDSVEAKRANRRVEFVFLGSPASASGERP